MAVGLQSSIGFVQISEAALVDDEVAWDSSLDALLGPVIDDALRENGELEPRLAYRVSEKNENTKAKIANTIFLLNLVVFIAVLLLPL